MTTTNQPSTDVAQKPIDTVKTALERMKPQLQMALPKTITPDRMVRVALTAIQNTPKLLECDRQSLYMAVLRSAQLGLEPDGVLGQAYLIPFAGKVQFIVGYKGLIDLARRSGEVSNIIAKEVCTNDDFKITWHEETPFKHEQPTSGERGEVIGFWALARFKDGGFHWDYMTVDEIKKVRDQSSGWQTAKKYNKTAESPWEKHFVEMAKKTVIRRIAKYLPMSVQKAAAVEDLVDAGKQFSTTEHGDIIIEGEASQVGESAALPTTSKLDAFSGTVDAETGEIIAENQAAAVSELPTQELPSFDINAHNLGTQTGTKEAVKQLAKYLAAQPQDARAAEFINHGGMSLVSVLGRHGLGREKMKFTDLGINLPQEGIAA
jgi:recombination protein RecT